jgi:DNA-binding protein YbaB
VEDERRWGFEEAEDWEYAAERRVDPTRVAEQDVADSSTGVDDSGAVTVVVGPDGQVRAVTLAADWRRALDPRALGASVLSAANNATMQALARSIEADQPAAPQPTVNATAPTDSLITREDAIRLMDAVTAELAAFTSKLDQAVSSPVTVESAGGHARGTAQNGQIVGFEVDAAWVYGAPNREIEGELVEVLRRLHASGTPSDLADGPRGPAIAELQALASDPDTLLRRVGLLP